MPYILVERSDLEEHDVSASSHHLNERAEERKDEKAEQQQQSQQQEQQQQEQQEQPCACDQISSPTTTQAQSTEDTGDGEEGEGADGPKVLKQPSLIQAERTDDHTWDAKTLGESGRGCCSRFSCFRRTRTENQIS
ncbi:unnamed protein product [Pylaiella littoralis]